MPLHEINHYLVWPMFLALLFKAVWRGLEDPEPAAFRLGAETRHASKRESLVAVEAEALGDHGSPQGQHWRAVDPDHAETLSWEWKARNMPEIQANNWYFHSIGNGCMALAIVNPGGCLPANTASTISGDRSVMRSSRLT